MGFLREQEQGLVGTQQLWIQTTVSEEASQQSDTGVKLREVL
jgi:hypothetical protein